MMKVKVSGTNQALSNIKKALSNLVTDDFVTVGIHEDENARPEKGINNATLGAIQHFGTDRIPARPWLDIGVEQSNQEYIQLITDGIADGLPIEQILNQLGIVAQASVQQYMVDLRTPPNAQSTITAKKSSNPLIDTGELRQSVTYKITQEKPIEGI